MHRKVQLIPIKKFWPYNDGYDDDLWSSGYVIFPKLLWYSLIQTSYLKIDGIRLFNIEQSFRKWNSLEILKKMKSEETFSLNKYLMISAKPKSSFQNNEIWKETKYYSTIIFIMNIKFLDCNVSLLLSTNLPRSFLIQFSFAILHLKIGEIDIGIRSKMLHYKEL